MGEPRPPTKLSPYRQTFVNRHTLTHNLQQKHSQGCKYKTFLHDLYGNDGSTCTYQAYMELYHTTASVTGVRRYSPGYQDNIYAAVRD